MKEIESRGTVTIETLSGDSGFTNLAITGNCVINGGTFTHKDNSSTETYRLRTTVGGTFTLGGSATIDADGFGYHGNAGPGASSGNYDGAGHGGMGGDDINNGTGMGQTYGSYLTPTNIGSGGRNSTTIRGGGAIDPITGGLCLLLAGSAFAARRREN